MRIRRSLAALAGASSLVLLAACGTGSSDSTATAAKGGLGGTSIEKQLDDLYQAAVKSGQTKVVTYGPGEAIYKPVYQDFEKRYPKITVNGDFIFGSELNSRLNQEFASGKHVGSLITGGGPQTAAAVGQNRCASYKPFTGDYLGGDLVGANDAYHATDAWAYGIEYNTNKLTKAEAPAGWQQLTDQKWKGKIVSEDLTTVTGTTNTIAGLIYSGHLDASWLSGIKANDPLIAPNRAVASQDVASGQRDVNVVVSYDTILQSKAKHLPVGFVFPTTEGSRLEYHYTCILEGAPSPDATKLLTNWLLTPEGQNALASVGVYGIRPGTDAPPGLPTLSSIQNTIVKSPPIDKQSQITKSVIETASNVFH